MIIYISLFVTALVAATLLPLSSEALLVSYVMSGYSAIGLWSAATLGNTMGSVINWWLGRQLLHLQDRPWFPFKPGKIVWAQVWFHRYGLYSLLLAWLPVVGDPLTFIAGVMRVNFWPFLILVIIGKGVRYGAVITFLSVVNQSG